MTDRREINAKKALAALPDATLIVDHAGRIIFASEQLQALLGYPPDVVLGQSIEMLVPDAMRDEHVALRQHYHHGPKILSMKGRRPLHARCRDGHVISVEIGLSPIEAGRLVICVMRSPSTATAREAALTKEVKDWEQKATANAENARQHEAHLRLFVKHTPAAVAMLDRDMRYLMVSDRWLEDFGVGQRNIIGLNHYEIFPNLEERWKEAHRRGLAGETVRVEEDVFRYEEGREEWLRWEVCPWREADGSVGGILIFIEFITQRKLNERALAENRQQLEDMVAQRTQELAAARDEAQRISALKSDFLAATAHDLRQPMQAAVNYLTFLRARFSDPTNLDLCDRALGQINAMTDTLDSLLDLASLDRGIITVRRSDFEVTELIGRVIATHLPTAQAKHIGLRQNTEPCWGYTDPALLERIVANLVSNAVRYTERGEVVVSCVQRDSELEIAIRDSGIGIPHNAFRRIFDEHVQLNNPERDRAKGLGLGLAIVRRICEILGHTLDVESQLGTGSVFRLTVPASPVRSVSLQTAVDDAEDDSTPSPELRILLIEDDPAVADSTAILLRFEGFNVHIGANRAEAVATVASGFRPDVIVSDYRLPDGSGPTVIEEVRSRLHAETPALLVTGDMVVDATELSIPRCQLLQKPVPHDRLLHAIKAAAADGILAGDSK